MRFWGKHGANPGERDQTQPIDVDLEIVAEIENAIASDDLAHAIDYAALYQTCERVVTQRSFALLETLADGIAEAVCGDTRVARHGSRTQAAPARRGDPGDRTPPF
jgi:dihydroneopterin aldolase